MNDLSSVFAHRHVVLPVIHVADEEQALRNTGIARDAGADGVFLIGHGMNADSLLAIHAVVFERNRDWWIGVNCLGLSPADVFTRVDNTIAGVWIDNALIDERTDSQPEAERVLEIRKQNPWEGLYFGGVAFKYQRLVTDLAAAAGVAAGYIDVVTTSGDATGVAANLKKIRAMKEQLGDHPLAIASGITPENVSDYLDSADCFLVATGIADSFNELNPVKAQELVEEVRQWDTERT